MCDVLDTLWANVLA